MIRQMINIRQINWGLSKAVTQSATKQSQRTTKKNSYLNTILVALGASFEKLCDITILKIKNSIAISQRATKKTQSNTKKNPNLNTIFVALCASFENLCDITLLKIKNVIATSQKAVTQRATKQSQRTAKKYIFHYLVTLFVELGASFEKLCDTTIKRNLTIIKHAL